ncbi:MAG: hypothetical protein GXX84_03640 [Acidobacteria bacterium]|nr:hypothetical protein [Acidobacteriota bacterium]
MKTGTGCFLAGILCLLSFGAVAGQTADEAKITVLNPRGIQPPIRKIPMAARPATLDGKTVYIVDTKYPRTKEFVDELVKILKEKRPETNWVLKEKFGGYMDDDPKLWAEIKEKAQAAIVLIGH